MNGVPNFSVLDGWWVEGYNRNNGWAIGENREYRDSDVQDEADSRSLYWTLEHDIIPLYYDRDESGVPHGWVQVAKEAMLSSLWQFSFRRTLDDYCARLYAPAALSWQAFSAKGFARAKDLAAWKAHIYGHWPEVSATATGPHETPFTIGETVQVTANVQLGALSPEEASVEIVYGEDSGSGFRAPENAVMVLKGQDANGAYRYTGSFQPQRTGALLYGVRVLPNHPDLLNKHEMALATWAT